MPKKNYKMKRNLRQRIQGAAARAGGVARGENPKTKAPRVLPTGAKPRLKPKGTTTGKTGGTQSLTYSRMITEKARRKKQK